LTAHITTTIRHHDLAHTPGGNCSEWWAASDRNGWAGSSESAIRDPRQRALGLKCWRERTSALAVSAVQFEGNATRTSVNRVANMAVKLTSQDDFTSESSVFTPRRYNHLIGIPLWTYVFCNAYHNGIDLPLWLFGASCQSNRYRQRA